MNKQKFYTTLLLSLATPLILTGCPEPDDIIYKCAPETEANDCPGTQVCHRQNLICVSPQDACGDLYTQRDEECDQGPNPSQSCAYGELSCMVCTSECKLIAGTTNTCGDGIIDPVNGEECDDGLNPTQSCDYDDTECEVCSPECKLIAGTTRFCGDQQVDRLNGEECDEGLNPTQNCDYGEESCQVCTPTCTLIQGTVTGFCGDDEVQVNQGEECDLGPAPEQDCPYGERTCQVCTSTCTFTDGLENFCGDGNIDNGEECDEGLTPEQNCDYGEESCQVCTSECTLTQGTVTGFCGDGEVQGNEECDGNAGVNTTTCLQATGLPYGKLTCNATCQFNENECYAIEELEGTFDNVCARDQAGRLYCWGSNVQNKSGQSELNLAIYTPTQIPSFEGAEQIYADAYSFCALKNAELYCWGKVVNLQTSPHTPTKVLGVTNVLKASVGEEHLCYITHNSQLYCMGNNLERQLGVSYTDTSNTPIQLSNITSPQEIIVSGRSSCAANQNNVYCWGQGAGSEGTITLINNTANPTDLAVNADGVFKGCGVTNQNLYCWGDTSAYIPGIYADPWYNAIAVPANDSGTLLSDVQRVELAQYHACAITSSADLYCWGEDGAFGRVGVAGDIFSLSYPNKVVHPEGDKHWVDVTLGEVHTCALDSIGQVWCWGTNHNGVLGLQAPDTYKSTTPEKLEIWPAPQ